jgi:anthranilate/para-aminobenzoate synthase component II
MVKALHGKQTEISKAPSSSILWNEIYLPCKIAHYHSLMVPASEIDQQINCLIEDNYIMSYENMSDKFIGVQFHPESFLTEQSARFAKNIFNWISNDQ